MKINKDKREKNSCSKCKVSVLLLVLAISLLVVSTALAEELDWVRQDGGLQYDYVEGIAIDNAGNSYITGYIYLSATFGAGEVNETTLATNGSWDAFVASYDGNGKLRWARQDGGSSSAMGYGIAADGAGNSYVTGYFYNTVTFGAGETNETVLVSDGFADVFVASYDRQGNLLWARRAGGWHNDEAYGIGVDKDGNSVLTGEFAATITFGEGEPNETTMTTTGVYNTDDVFVASYDKEGNLRWARQAGGTDNDYVNGITVHKDGNSYVTGFFYPSATFGAGEAKETILSADWNWNTFVAGYDREGKLIWAEKVGGTSTNYGKGIAVDEAGNTYVTGSFSQTAIFGAGEPNETPLTSSSMQDIFIAKYNTDGEILWARQAGDLYSESGEGIAVDREGNSYVIGSFYDEATFGVGEENQVTLTAYSEAEDIFVAVYDQNGKFFRVQQDGGLGCDYGIGIAVDMLGNSYITGIFNGDASFGTEGSNETTLTSSGEYDIYVARYNWRVQQEKIQKVIDEISDLIESGSLNEGQANSLIKKLEVAAKSLGNENIEAAIGQLEAFINAIEAAIQSDNLTPEVGQPLIDAVQDIINYLEA
jgi:hypothetical protein